MKHSRAVGVVVVALFVAAGLLAVACGSDEPGSAVEQGRLLVATTTSLNDSGLLDDVVLPAYERLHPGVTVKVVAVGSGEAIAMGAQGEADVLLVHSPADEAAFMADGHGTLRLPFAYNYFVIVGPAGRPGRRHAGEDGRRRLRRHRRVVRSTFVSRGDESGTNKKELKLWDAAGVHPEGDWYLSARAGHGRDPAHRQREAGLHAHRPGDVPVAQGAHSIWCRCSRAARTSRTSTDVIIVNQNEFPTVNAAAAEQLAQVLVERGRPEGHRRLRRGAVRQAAVPAVRRRSRQLRTTARAAGACRSSGTGSSRPCASSSAATAELRRSPCVRSGSRGWRWCFAVAVGVPLGAVVALNEFRGRRSRGHAINTGMAAPPVVVGLLVALFLTRSGPLGDLRCCTRTWAMVIAQVVIALPIVMGLSLAALQQLDPGPAAADRGARRRPPPGLPPAAARDQGRAAGRP